MLTSASRPLKSSGFLVYTASPLAAAVEAISKSASRVRAVRPAARVAAKTRPYMRAAPASNGRGSHVSAAHWSRSCLRARSSSLRAAWGPAASSARVTAAIADSWGRTLPSIAARSIKTEVSSNPRLGPATVSANQRIDLSRHPHHCETARHLSAARSKLPRRWWRSKQTSGDGSGEAPQPALHFGSPRKCGLRELPEGQRTMHCEARAG